MNFSSTKYLVVYSALLAFLTLPTRAHALFTQSDISLAVEAEQSFILPGDTAYFDALITNNSSEDISWGGNLRITAQAVGPKINGVASIDSPFAVADSFIPSFQNGSISAGSTVRELFYSVDTTDSIPEGSIVSMVFAGFGFENIPAEFPNDNKEYDFWVKTVNPSTVTVDGPTPTPEPGTLSLLFVGLIPLTLYTKRQHSTSQDVGIASW